MTVNYGEFINDELNFLEPNNKFEIPFLQNRVLLGPASRPLEVEEALNLCDFFKFRSSYYHGLLQYLPRLFLLEETIGNSALPVLIPESMPRWQRDLLEIAGIDPDRLVTAPADDWTRVRRLHVAEPTDQLRVIEPSEIAALRRAIFRDRKFADAETPRYLYISRRRYHTRILVNEAEIEETAERCGLTVVRPEELPLADQIGLFSGAQLIAGASGAGLSNMVFMPSNSEVVCLTPRRRARTAFLSPAAALNHRFTFVLGESLASDGPFRDVHFSPFTVDAKDIEIALRTALGRLSAGRTSSRFSASDVLDDTVN
jgi:hypothetical protein